MDHAKLQNILDKSIDNKKVFGTVFCIRQGSGSWCGAAGNFDTGTQYFIASTSKLFTTAFVLGLRSEGRIDLDHRISEYLPDDIMEGLHILKGKEYSGILTVRHLLAHTSGLPDYFMQKGPDGSSILSNVTSGRDIYLSFEEMIKYSKSQKSRFIPDTKGKAFYSDTNFQLLGRIIENISGKTLSENFNDRIIKPLGLQKTYLFEDFSDNRPMDIYFKDKPIHIPMMMASFKPDGGIVSVAEEMILFTDAFFKGRLFPTAYIDELKKWNRIFFPMQSGVGIHRFFLPRIFDPFRKIPELIGHSGLSGSIAFYSPQHDLSIAGTVNQVTSPGTSFRMAIKLINEMLKNEE
jgi:CubicO group peptidase (beta-lactamase class C family)